MVLELYSSTSTVLEYYITGFGLDLMYMGAQEARQFKSFNDF